MLKLMSNHSNSTPLARFRFNITKNISSMFKKYFTNLTFGKLC